MKKAIIKLVTLVMCGSFIIGCSEQGANNSGSGSTAKTDRKLEADLYKLAHMNGCIDCHRVKSMVIGPSWQDIADRYKDAPAVSAREILIESVKKGSKGNWITWKAPDGMPPMEKRVSEEHIATLVDYILSLNRAPGVDDPVTDAATIEG